MPLSSKKKRKSVKQRFRNERGSALFALILSCFFISGLTGLIYEILWTRMIVKIIGGAPFAVTIVLTVFMGGLGLGSYLASRRIDRVKDPRNLVRIYGVLELVIGAYGILLPLLLILFRPLYAIIYNQLFQYFLGYNLITFVGCLLLLIVPTTCMGATLPVLSRFFITRLSRVGTHVGRLYGFNTIGAAAGALLCGFFLVQLWGVYGTLFFAVTLNAVIGIICVFASRNPQKKEAKAAKKKPETKERRREKKPLEPEHPALRKRTGISALIVFGISGFCAMAYEVIWTKLLGILVGPTTYSFTIVLVTFISGLALGSLFFGWLGDRAQKPLRLLLFTQIAAALFALILSQILGNSQIFFAKLIFHWSDHFAVLALLKVTVLFAFMFFPTFCLGATFPLVGKIYTRTLSKTGESIGVAYAINSGGAILGSFCAGFVLIPLVGKELGLRLIVALQLITASIIGAYAIWKEKERVAAWMPLVFPAFLTFVLLFPFPHWDRRMLSIGKYHRFEKHEMRAMGWFEALFFGMERFSHDTEGEVVYFGDGIGGFTTVLKTKLDIFGNESYALYCSGKPEASSKLDMDTQTLSAHVPMLFHKDPERVLVIGLASGVTAGEVLHYPVDQLEVIDINSLVVEASHFFRPWNNHVLSHPKTKLIVQDARAHMELSNTTYDVISSEPSNPWMAGLAALFTKDFFSLVKSRLKDEGIFVQFIHTYQMDWSTFSLVGRTFAEVFPESLLMRTNPSSLGPDFLLVGFKGEGGLKEHFGARQLYHARQSSNVVLNNHRVLYHLIVSEDLQRLFGDGPIHTDARPWLEFSAPKLLHTHDPAIAKQLDSRSWLSEETLNIIRQDAENVDFQIAYAEFALSVLRPEMAFQNPVDLSRASPDQKKRLFIILRNFCKNNIVTDYSFFGDSGLKRACISTQIEAAKQRLPKAQETTLLHLHLGALYGELGLTEDALRNFAEAEQGDPANAHVHYNQAVFFSKLGRTEEAIHHYSETLRLDPYYINASNNLAWIFATHGNPKFRSGHKAVQLSEYACRLDGRKDPYLLDTLAAAYAETGRFKKAQLTALEAIDRAQLIGVDQLVRDIERRLILYQSRHPYHKKGGHSQQLLGHLSK